MKPILFNTEMVKAILSGKKTQTRRVISKRDDYGNLPPMFDIQGRPDWPSPVDYVDFYGFTDNENEFFKCPYGKPGGNLWVRERWRKFNASDECSHYDDCNCYRNNGAYMYYADDQNDENKWKPSIHMPQEAARLFLKIKNIRVERVQDISEEDAKAEGIEPLRCKSCGYTYADCRYWLDHNLCGKTEPASNVEKFHGLWDSINAERGYGWDENPWVWVIEFKMI